MHAIVQTRLGGPEELVLQELPELMPQAGQVRIAVESAGVHLVDTVIRRGEFHVPTSLPMTPGREVAGTVDRVPDDVDQSWLGRRVVAHLGQANGGYADQAVVPVESLHEVPAVLTSTLAIAAIGTGRTVTGILDLAPIDATDRVVVTAASGGVGALLIREAHRVGAEVIGLAGGSEKVRAVERLGAVAIDSRSEAWLGDVANALGGAPTLAFDGVGEPTSSGLWDLLSADGRLVNYNGQTQPFSHPTRRLIEVLGPAMTARDGGLRSLETEALARAADGSRVPLVGEPFGLAEAAEAHRALEARRTIGKVTLSTRADA